MPFKIFAAFIASSKIGPIPKLNITASIKYLPFLLRYFIFKVRSGSPFLPILIYVGYDDFKIH